MAEKDLNEMSGKLSYESVLTETQQERAENEVKEKSAVAESVAENQPEENDKDEASSMSREEIATLIAEAEQRGYLRGRNEAVSLAMNETSVWSMAGSDSGGKRQQSSSESDTAFLRHIRPSVWD